MTPVGPLAAVTVISPVFDDAARVEALAAAFEPFLDAGARVVAVDDGSRDGGGERLRELLGGRPGFRLLVQETNQGVAAARNRALAEVETDYVWFCDSDDRWEPDILTALLGRAVTTDADVVVSGARISHDTDPAADPGRILELGAGARVVDGAGAARLMLDGTWHGYLWNKLFRRAHVQGLRFPDQRSQSDFPFTFEALSRARTVASLDRVLYTHLLRPDSVSQARSTHDNLRRCWQRVAESWTPPAGERTALEHFRVWFYVAAAAGSIWRSSLAPVDQRAALREVRASTSWRDLPRAARHSRRTLARVVLLLLFGKHSATVVGLALRRRRKAARAARNPTNPTDPVRGA